MENKQYEKLVNSFKEEDKTKVGGVADFVSKVYNATYSHYVNNALGGIRGFMQWYEQSDKTESDKEQFIKDMVGESANIKKVSAIMMGIPRMKFEDIKFTEDPASVERNHTIPLEEIFKEK